MFFRNLTLFRFSQAATPKVDDLAAALAEHPLHPCGALELFSRGFVPPQGDPEAPLVVKSGDAVLVCLGGEDKLLPTSVVNAAVTRKAHDLAAERGHPVSGRERRQIRDTVITDLLPRAFSQPSRLSAYLDLRRGWLVIDTTSRKAAEGLVGALRNALGGFPALPAAPGTSPTALLTQWLDTGSTPDDLLIGTECELRDPAASAGAKWRGRNVALDTNEVHEHLHAGKQVSQLGLEYNGRFGFVLDEQLVLRKLRFFDATLDDLDNTESEAEESAARLALMTLELGRFFDQFTTWFEIDRPE